ncbi:probable acetyltransferase YPO3809 [Cronobacter dublinensis 582]|nr:probable acetyltransferase YPO3809 [Cronobacter dublinensis 582]
MDALWNGGCAALTGGVGHYLIEETIRDNPSMTDWWVMDIGVEDYNVMNAFMQTLGFAAQQDGWVKRVEA